MRSLTVVCALGLVGLLALAASTEAGVRLHDRPVTAPGRGAELLAPDPVLIGAGDIAVCGEPGAARVADRIGKLIQQDPHAVLLTAGDNSNEEGSRRQFEQCFAPTWGRFRDRIFPSPGNHDYKTDGAAGYFDYFGRAAGDREQGYHSRDLGAWHLVALNSNCRHAGGCESGSTQERWLRGDLAQRSRRCTLAYFHHPLFSSGDHGQAGTGSKDDRIRREILPLVDALFESGAEIIVNGHDHHYERFAPQDPRGRLDPSGGIRHFVVGTGGADLRSLGSSRAANSEVQIAHRHGVVRFVLGAAGYTWQFVAADDGSVLDAGSGTCH